MTIESELGLSLKLILAGLSGGLVNAITFRSDWRTSIAAMVVGAFVANYIGPLVAKLIDMPEPVAGFICGMAALVIVTGTINLVQSRFTHA